MFCSDCGTRLPDGSIFCHGCGSKTDVGTQPVQRPPDPERPTQTAVATPPARPVFTPPAPVRPAAVARQPARPVRQPVAPRPVVRPPVAAGPPQPSARYIGASLVAITLWVLGWLIAFLGIVAASAVAADSNPFEVFEGMDSSEGAGARIAVFMGTALAFWLVAVFILWGAYALRLLSDLEVRLRSGGADRAGGASA